MVMYDELVKRLRETSIDFGELDHVSVMLIEAADAIEDLITALTASNEVIAKSKQQHTNADIIRSMTDEEMATFLGRIIQPRLKNGYTAIRDKTDETVARLISSWLEWLEQECEP